MSQVIHPSQQLSAPIPVLYHQIKDVLGMDTDRSEKVQAICRSALTLAAGLRPVYLDRECAGDAGMRVEVESLIAAATPTETYSPGAAQVLGDPDFAGNDRFIVQRRLGSGGFGVVYQVYDRHREAVLALKILRRPGVSPLLQLKNEFRVLADIVHPNLVTLHELMSEDGRWFFTMELVDGVDFLHYVRALGDDFERLRGAMRQLADGLSAVHRYGKLHCDLKPRNVLVDSGGRLLILDFGLVTDASDSTGRGVAFGTPGYMSPEQAEGLPVSRASDWYSVGVMLYEALTGGLPFPGQPAVDASSIARLRPNAPRDLCELAAALLQGNPLLRPAGSQVLRSLGMPPEESMRVAWFEPEPFLGRENELAALRQTLRETGRGRPATVFIHGPSGAGKSALARRFLNEVRAVKTYLVLEGRCHERESMPYKALDSLVDNLNRHLAAIPKAARTPLIPADFWALTLLFPVLEPLVEKPESIEIASPAELRLRGFQALRELLGRLAVRQPIVLLIDDLQWGDVDSSAFLIDLVCDPAPVPILFLACYRSDEAETSPLLRKLLPARSLRVAGHRVELPLQDLDYGAARDLALSLLSRHETVAAAVAEQIARESGGNPFFLAELVKLWQTGSADGSGGRPPTAEASVSNGRSISLDDLVLRRVAILTERSRRLLEVIALAGQPVELAIAGSAARLEAGAFTEMAQLLRHRLIRTRRTESSEEIEAYHDRIRQSTEAAMSPEGLRDCHGRLAATWESAGRSDPRFLAIHFRGAGVADKALAYSIRAAEEAAAALAFDNAAQFYRFAAELAPQNQRDAWLVKLGEALCNAGRGPEGARVYLTVSGAVGGARNIELRRLAAAHLLMAGQMEEGLALTREVLKVVKMRLHRWAWQAILSFSFWRLCIRARGLKFHERAASEIPAFKLLRMDVCASLVQGLAMVDPIRAHPFHARLLLLALRSGEISRISRAFCSEAGYLALRGGRQKERVESLLISAQELAERSANPNDRGLVALAMGMSAFLRGEWKSAAERMAVAEGILRERCTGVSWEVATAHMMGSVSLSFMGEWQQLKLRLPRIIRDAEARGDRFEATDLRTRLAHIICLAADNAGQAREEIRAAMAEWRREQFDLQHWWAWLGNIETDLYEGDARSAWTRVAAEWPRLRWSLMTRVQYIYLESLHHRARAALALAAQTAAGERRELLAHAERDARRMEREGAPWSSALATLMHAGIAAVRGAPEESARLLDLSERQLGACDMSIYACVARRARGRLLGGAAGRDLSAEAEERMQKQEILNPERIAATLAPGF
jgi:serine/threonine protein kinase